MQTSTRFGLPWTGEEENRLLEHLKTETVESCANFLGRTPGAITARLQLIAERLVKGGAPIEEVTIMTTLSPEQIYAGMSKNSNFNHLPTTTRQQGFCEQARSQPQFQAQQGQQPSTQPARPPPLEETLYQMSQDIKRILEVLVEIRGQGNKTFL